MPRIEIEEDYVAPAPSGTKAQVNAAVASEAFRAANPSASVIMSGGSSTATGSRKTGETFSEANARITQDYKNLTAKPIPSAEQLAAGMKVQWVRTGVGGQGEWTTTVPSNYKGDRTVRNWTEGIIPSSSKYTTGKSVGTYIAGTNQGGTGGSSWGTPANPFENLGGTLYKNGMKFTGTVNGITYKDGIPISSSDDSDGSFSGNGSYGDKTLISTTTNPDTGEVIGYFSDGSQAVLTQGSMSTAYKDAYALLQDTFRSYGLEELIPIIEGYMKANTGPEQAALQLKQTQPYKDRFKGNQLRLAAGQNALSEAEYLNLENSYIETLNAYGLGGYFGKDRKSQVEGMAKVIGGDVSATEFAGRVSTVVNQVQNGDPRIKGMLKAYYNIDDADIIKYYLDPSKDNLAALKQKTATAEIGAAGAEQGLGVQKTTAEQLAAVGVTQEQARAGYKTISDVLPVATKLSDIYDEARIGYNQATAEAEVFGTSGAASAQRKRRQLAELEQAAFGGKAGVNENSLGKSLQGRF